MSKRFTAAVVFVIALVRTLVKVAPLLQRRPLQGGIRRPHRPHAGCRHDRGGSRRRWRRRGSNRGHRRDRTYSGERPGRGSATARNGNDGRFSRAGGRDGHGGGGHRRRKLVVSWRRQRLRRQRTRARVRVSLHPGEDVLRIGSDHRPTDHLRSGDHHAGHRNWVFVGRGLNLGLVLLVVAQDPDVVLRLGRTLPVADAAEHDPLALALVTSGHLSRRLVQASSLVMGAATESGLARLGRTRSWSRPVKKRDKLWLKNGGWRSVLLTQLAWVQVSELPKAYFFRKFILS